MLTTKSTLPYHLPSLHIVTSQRVQVSSFNPSCLLLSSTNKCKCQFLGNQKLQILRTSLELQYGSNKKMNMAVYSGVDPGSSLPSDPSSPASWKVWILGMAISIILPFWRNKWWPLLMFRDKVESVVETAEQITDVVEKVAEEVEKVAEEIGDNLPEGGKLKQVARIVENVAKETAKDAHLVEEVIDKVEDLEKDVESLIETPNDQANEINKEANDSQLSVQDSNEVKQEANDSQLSIQHSNVTSKEAKD